MRRSGSASCILRPKNSLSAEDLQRLATEAPTATVLTIDRLPSYCTDRLYMLSELQVRVHANSIRFLCDVASSGPSSAPGGASNSNIKPPAFPPSIILYLLWKPNTYPTPRSFADGPLSECVRRCLLANGDEAPGEELDDVRSSPRSSPYSPRRKQLIMENNNQIPLNKCDPLGVFGKIEGADSGDSSASGNNNGREESNASMRETQQLTRIYVVIDRISPSDSDDSFDGVGELPNFPNLALSSSSYEDNKRIQSQKGHSTAAVQPGSETSQSQSNPPEQKKEQSPTKEERQQQQLNQHNNEIKTAEQLARAVASSRFLRNRIDGISIGITSDARAAPGLEACMDTMERGAKERRMAARDRSVTSKKIKGGMHDFKDDLYHGDVSMQRFRRREQTLDRLREQSPERSPIAIVAMQPDDLEGVDHHDHSHHHHDHSEHGDIHSKVLQCRVSTEWNGKGEYKTFSDRAMRDWRQAWFGAHEGSNDDNAGNRTGSRGNNGICVRPKVPRISSRGREEEEMEVEVDEPISTAMVVVFLAVLAVYVWNSYGDLILSFILW
ncbi:hypothetical protein ACHAXR_006062 [Thalassiosira sp. AJA248-18]